MPHTKQSKKNRTEKRSQLRRYAYWHALMRDNIQSLIERLKETLDQRGVSVYSIGANEWLIHSPLGRGLTYSPGSFTGHLARITVGFGHGYAVNLSLPWNAYDCIKMTGQITIDSFEQGYIGDTRDPKLQEALHGVIVNWFSAGLFAVLSVRRMRILKEELLAAAWAPARVARWLEAGIDPEDM